MAYHFHQDRKLYFDHQCQNALEYVIPFVEAKKPFTPGMKVLEIGCGEGGVVQAFALRGCQVTGVELDVPKYEQARVSLEDFISTGQVRLFQKNIYDVDFLNDPESRFDLIVLKDVIEHIHDQPRLMRAMQGYLRPGGMIFFGFPPWHMPFGGHQQICEGGLLSRLPWFHLLPWPLYKAVLRWGKESQETIDSLRDIWETRITIGQFERYARETGYRKVHEKLYLVNPIYRFKFGLAPREQFPLIGKIPYLRNFVTTCGYYLLQR
ncbi:MAG: class I SAM-dependent methyltransferase [Bernardetiaceae bacterium]